jgi:hypothetical protein
MSESIFFPYKSTWADELCVCPLFCVPRGGFFIDKYFLTYKK